MRKYDAVIFDLDGTLVDSLESDVESLARCARKFGLPPVPRETSLRLFGLSNMDFYRVVFPDAGEAVYERLLRMQLPMQSEIAREMGERVLFPGVKEMLEQLKCAGLRLFIASTGTREHVYDFLTFGGVLPLFERIGFDEPVKDAMTARLLEGVDPARAVFVGDSGKDVQTAHANGLPALGAGFGYVYSGDGQFDAVYDTPAELARALLAEEPLIP